MHTPDLPRRRLLAAIAAGSAAPLSLLSTPAHAQDYPNRPITVVVAQAAGGGSDTLTRLWADYVSRVLGQPVVVDNRPGAAGIVAAQAVLQRPADGYTLFSAGTSSIILNKITMKSLPYDGKDFRGVTLLAKFSYLLLASAASGIRSMEDLQRVARANPGRLNFGSGGIGNGSHMMLELLQSEGGIKLNHVPYKGELPYLNGLLANEVQVVIASVGVSLGQIQAGRIVPLAVLGEKPVPELPNVPLARQVGLKGFEGLFWAAILAKAGTPDAVSRRLHAASQQFLNDPESAKKMERMQLEPAPGPVDAYETLLATDTRRWMAITRPMNLSFE